MDMPENRVSIRGDLSNKSRAELIAAAKRSVEAARENLEAQGVEIIGLGQTLFTIELLIAALEAER